jgi:hypothetical protein
MGPFFFLGGIFCMHVRWHYRDTGWHGYGWFGGDENVQLHFFPACYDFELFRRRANCDGTAA